jgi:hypothetical protein
MKTDPAEANHDDATEVARSIKLVEDSEVRGEIPVEVLLQQLDQLATMNNDLRLMLKEARYETRLLRTEMANVHAHGKALEDSMKLVQALSEARHFEIERLGEVLRRTDAKLRAIQQNPVVKVVYRYHAVRRLLRRSGA